MINTFEGQRVNFHGQEYASNYMILPQFKDKEQLGIKPDEGDLVGMEISYLVTQENDKIPDECLVWIEDQIVGMTKKRYGKERRF